MNSYAHIKPMTKTYICCTLENSIESHGIHVWQQPTRKKIQKCFQDVEDYIFLLIFQISYFYVFFRGGYHYGA